jgi:phosphoribosylformimino-5-aminoimidazole carboxamide ribotide isomerase
MDLVSKLLGHGVSRLALVDVDAAHNTGNNRELIGRILETCSTSASPVCAQVAGGIRSSDQAQFFVDHGASWLVVGTILHKSPSMVEGLVARFQRHLIAAIDARGGEVHCSGWVDQAGLQAQSLAAKIRAYGFKRLLFVDIPSDVNASPDFDTARQIGESTKLPILMGGSILTREHLQQAAKLGGLHGVLVDSLLVLEDVRLLDRLPQGVCLDEH